jgi:hypothetical protein
VATCLDRLDAVVVLDFGVWDVLCKDCEGFRDVFGLAGEYNFAVWDDVIFHFVSPVLA